MKDLSKIKALVFDVDGIFTNGGIFCDLQGELFRTFDAKDGFGVRMAYMNGYHLGIITGGRSMSIRARFKTCGIMEEDVYLGSRNKMEDMEDFCRRHHLQLDEVLYMGDDLPDAEVMSKAGVSATPCDAVEEIRQIADIVTEQPGGHGSVRHVVESVMKQQGRWTFDVHQYKKEF